MRKVRIPPFSPATASRILPALIVMLGAFLRFRHLDWAAGYYFQPDESVHTIDYLMRLPPSLNPYEVGLYTYGGLPLYLYLFSARFLRFATGNPAWMDKWHITLIVRGYAALASTLTIWLVARLAEKLGMKRTAWAAALGFAVSPLAIQYAHYGAVDTLFTFWVVLTSFLSVWAWEMRKHWRWLVVGAALGLAVATKTTALVWSIVIGTGTWYVWRETRNKCTASIVLIWGAVGALAAILVGSPYYLLDWASFHQIMVMQAGKTVTGRILCTYHWQFLNVRPYLFELEQLSQYALGIPLAIAGGWGFLGGWKEIAYGTNKWRWILVLFPPTLYFVMIGMWHSKFIRYLLPFVPYVCVCAAWPLDTFLRSPQRILKWGTALLTTVALLHSTCLGIATSSIYSGTDPRLAASEWMLEHVPEGATILHDPEPLILLPLGAAERFQIEVLDLFGNSLQNIQDVGFYVRALQDKQYVVIVSRRQYGAVNHLAAMFPVATCYYRSLFDGRLGYSLVARFTNYPHIGNWAWNTDKAEETFQVFDHPVVHIFQRSQVQTPEQIRNTLETCLHP